MTGRTGGHNVAQVFPAKLQERNSGKHCLQSWVFCAQELILRYARNNECAGEKMINGTCYFLMPSPDIDYALLLVELIHVVILFTPCTTPRRVRLQTPPFENRREYSFLAVWAVAGTTSFRRPSWEQLRHGCLLAKSDNLPKFRTCSMISFP